MKNRYFGASTRLLVMSVLLQLLVLPACATGPSAEDRFNAALDDMEREMEGRIGAFVIDARSGRTLGHRSNERFAVASTFKPLLVAAILAEVDAGRLSLDDALGSGGIEIQPHSPVVGKLGPDDTLSLAALCEAAITISDNTATNLLFDRVDGPQGLTQFLREYGDDITRMDRYEVALNTNLPGDPRDTSTPQALAESYLRFVTSDILSEASQSRLQQWLVASRTGRKRLRAGLPADWRVGDKTGFGANGAVNNVAVAWPAHAQPFVIVVLMSETDKDVATLNAVHARIATLAVDILQP